MAQASPVGYLKSAITTNEHDYDLEYCKTFLNKYKVKVQTKTCPTIITFETRRKVVQVAQLEHCTDKQYVITRSPGRKATRAKTRKLIRDRAMNQLRAPRLNPADKKFNNRTIRNRGL